VLLVPTVTHLEIFLLVIVERVLARSLFTPPALHPAASTLHPTSTRRRICFVALRRRVLAKGAAAGIALTNLL